MSHVYLKTVSSLTTTLTGNSASTIATLSATLASRSTSTLSATNISDQMREDAMDVVVVKIISLLVLTILSVLCGLLPLRLLIYTPHLFAHSRNTVDYCLCCLRLFSGGKMLLLLLFFFYINHKFCLFHRLLLLLHFIPD